MKFRLATALVLTLLLAMPLAAEPLPKGVVPIEGAALKQIYAGNSMDWSATTAYFAPDGTVKGISKDGQFIFWGSWSTKKNEVCMTVQGVNLQDMREFDESKDCWKWWTDGGEKPITLWTKAYDDSKLDLKNGHYRGEVDKRRKGDIVSKKFDRSYRKIKS